MPGIGKTCVGDGIFFQVVMSSGALGVLSCRAEPAKGGRRETSLGWKHLTLMRDGIHCRDSEDRNDLSPTRIDTPDADA